MPFIFHFVMKVEDFVLSVLQALRAYAVYDMKNYKMHIKSDINLQK